MINGLLKECECIHLTDSYTAQKLKDRGVKVDNLRITDNFFIPNDKDLIKMTNFLSDCKTIIDVGSGKGLLITKLAERNINSRFLGIDSVYWEKGYIKPIDRINLKFRFNGIEALAYAEKYNNELIKHDCVICSWMPDGSDWREMLSKICNKKIILVLSRDFCTGTIETYTGLERFGLSLKKAWISSDSIIQLWKKK
jgi:hypothetical protein